MGMVKILSKCRMSTKLCMRHGQYWQIAYQTFMVAQNCIKKDLEIIDTFNVKYCSVLLHAVLENGPQNRDNFLKHNKIYPFSCNFW
jgi:hypothetical protein